MKAHEMAEYLLKCPNLPVMDCDRYGDAWEIRAAYVDGGQLFFLSGGQSRMSWHQVVDGYPLWDDPEGHP